MKKSPKTRVAGLVFYAAALSLLFYGVAGQSAEGGGAITPMPTGAYTPPAMSADGRATPGLAEKPLWLKIQKPGYQILQPSPLRYTKGLNMEFLRTILEGFGAETPEAGPTFNATSCMACHNQPAPGGRGTPELKVLFFMPNVQPRPVAPTVFRRLAREGHPRMALPPNLLAKGERIAPPLFTLGAMLRVPAAAMQKEVARQKGRPTAGALNWLPPAAAGGPKRLGRLGQKSTQPDLTSFIHSAFLNEMSVTTGPLAQLNKQPDKDGDGLGEPEVAERYVIIMHYLIQSFIPPWRWPPHPAWKTGQKLFQQTGCAACHTPTQPNAKGKPVTLYSDLLLHDMGPGLSDHMPAFGASASQWRTTPLLGLIGGGPYLQDGRAATLREAILAHGGQAKTSRDRFAHLNKTQQEALEGFLNSIVPWQAAPSRPAPPPPWHNMPPPKLPRFR